MARAFEQTQLHGALNAVDRTLRALGQGKLGADGIPFRSNVTNSIWARRDYPIEWMFLDTLTVDRPTGADPVSRPSASAT